MSFDKETAIDMLAWLEHWWEQSKGNPLYAWKAISFCLSQPEDLPGWAKDYLRKTADNIVILSFGRDFRDPTQRVEPDEAAKLIAAALGISRERAKNAFARLADDDEAQRAAMNAPVSYAPTVVAELMKNHSVEADRAKRIIARGRRLLAKRRQVGTSAPGSFDVQIGDNSGE